MPRKGKRPAFQFYPNDWIGDLALQSCSFAAQGLWINMLCRMHDSPTYGKLLLQQNGKQIYIKGKTLAKVVGATLEEINELISELEAHGVLTIDEKTGAYMSKRMVKDEELRVIRAEAGGKGGKKTASKFALAKRQQMVEDDYEEEVSKVIKDTRVKKKYFEWLVFCNYELRKRVTPTALTKQLNALAKLDPTDAILVIDHSMENGYQGLFPAKAPQLRINQTKNIKELTGKENYGDDL